MAKSHVTKVVEKSRAACIAAVETYNRVAVPYREESFTILMVNAWELLLKAKVMRDGPLGAKGVYAYEKVDNSADRRKSDRRIKKNRSGAPMTIGIEKCIQYVRSHADGIDGACACNIESLIEVRDNAIHFINDDVYLLKIITELVLASVRNYVISAQRWFNVSFSDLNISSVPLSFDLDQKKIHAAAMRSSKHAMMFLQHVWKNEIENNGLDSIYAYTVDINYDIVKKKSEDAVKTIATKDDSSVPVKYTINTLPGGFDITYKKLMEKFKALYSDFRQTNAFRAELKRIQEDPKYSLMCYNDPYEEKGGKRFYNANILRAFTHMFILA